VKRSLRSEDGVAVIEFALTLPLLLVIVLGMFDFAMAFRQYQVMTNAAREGARMAVLPGYSDSDIETRVSDYLTASGVTATVETALETESVSPASGPSFSVRHVTLTSTYTFSFLGPIAGLFGGNFSSVTLTAQSVMRTEVAGG
jgi:Flp pilus assembly protein TadG